MADAVAAILQLWRKGWKNHSDVNPAIVELISQDQTCVRQTNPYSLHLP